MGFLAEQLGSLSITYDVVWAQCTQAWVWLTKKKLLKNNVAFLWLKTNVIKVMIH